MQQPVGAPRPSMWRLATQAVGSQPPTRDAIARRAYLKYLEHTEHNCALRDWLDAERELIDTYVNNSEQD